MPIIITDIPQSDANILNCITTAKEIFIPAREVPVIDYLVTVYPRNDNNGSPFPFVYGLFEEKKTAFANNQDVILGMANSMFSNSQPLSVFEQNVLNISFRNSIKDKPTLSGRK